MKKWSVYIIALADDEDRTEYVADEFHGFETRDEAVKAKREMLDFDGIWSGCDVYAKIVEEED